MDGTRVRCFVYLESEGDTCIDYGGRLGLPISRKHSSATHYNSCPVLSQYVQCVPSADRSNRRPPDHQSILGFVSKYAVYRAFALISVLCRNDITFFTTGSLYYLPYIDGSKAIGLHDGTLYDVPKPNAGVENVTVDATGFNITCGYRKDVKVEPTQGQGWRMSSSTTSRNIPSTRKTISITGGAS